MLIAGVIAICIVLLILAFVAPGLSRGPQQGVNKGFGVGRRGAAKAPGKLGGWLQKPFNNATKATDKSASAGRSARSKLPI